MEMSEIHAAADVPVSKSTSSAKRGAPNGKNAVLVDGLWAGYLCIEGGGSRGGGTREIAVFEVGVINGATLQATYRKNVSGKDKKALNKRIHHERAITLIEARTTSGDRCQLFTE
jgi:hypothetical protein